MTHVPIVASLATGTIGHWYIPVSMDEWNASVLLLLKLEYFAILNRNINTR
jgi:hypothetical protein